MELVISILGWAAALIGAVTTLPQLIKILRSGTTAGISLTNFQLLLANFIAWVGHGVIMARPYFWLTNACLLVINIVILRKIIVHRVLNPVTPWIMGTIIGFALIGVDLWSHVAFGVLVLFPQGFGALAQVIDIARKIDISGLSGLYIFISFFIQLLWLIWALLARDTAVIMAASVQGSIALVAFLWLVARSFGASPIFPIDNQAPAVQIEVPARGSARVGA